MSATVAVIAAQGRSGRATVQALLDAGYSVRAGVRKVGTIRPHAGLEEVPVDALVRSDLARLLEGVDVVVSMIGHHRGTHADIQQVMTRHCISLIHQSGRPIRFITLSGTGIRRPGDRYSIIDRAANLAISLVDPARIRDGKRHVELLERSGIDFTVIRVLKLTNARHSGGVRLTPGGPAENFTPRVRVGEAVVQVIKEDSFHRELPVISGN